MGTAAETKHNYTYKMLAPFPVFRFHNLDFEAKDLELFPFWQRVVYGRLDTLNLKAVTR